MAAVTDSILVVGDQLEETTHEVYKASTPSMSLMNPTTLDTTIENDGLSMETGSECTQWMAFVSTANFSKCENPSKI